MELWMIQNNYIQWCQNYYTPLALVHKEFRIGPVSPMWMSRKKSNDSQTFQNKINSQRALIADFIHKKLMSIYSPGRIKELEAPSVYGLGA